MTTPQDHRNWTNPNRSTEAPTTVEVRTETDPELVDRCNALEAQVAELQASLEAATKAKTDAETEAKRLVAARSTMQNVCAFKGCPVYVIPNPAMDKSAVDVLVLQLRKLCEMPVLD